MPLAPGATSIAPGYLAIASAGVAPLSTASVRAISTLELAPLRAIEARAADADSAEDSEPFVSNNFELAQAAAGVITYVMQPVATASERKKCPSASYPFVEPLPRKMKSSSRSRPPVSRRLVSSSAALLENGWASFPSEPRRASSGLTAVSAGPEIFDVLPRFVKNFCELLENAGRLVKALSIPGAATFRSLNTGVV